MRTRCGFSGKWASFISMLVVLAAGFAYAEPYNGEQAFTYHQPDGSTFSVRLFGDEFFAYQRTEDGREVLLDAKSGFYCYAQLSADGKSFESTGVPVVTRSSNQSQSMTRALLKGVAKPNQTLPPEVVMLRVRKAQAELGRDDRGRPLRHSSGDNSPAGQSVNPSPPSAPTTGDVLGLCILVDFPDEPGTIAQKEIDNMLNQPSGYTGFGNACSANEYFRIQSNGKMNFCNTVTAYVRMPKPKTYYDDNSPYGAGKADELFETALAILMEQDFDFTPFTFSTVGTTKYIKSASLFYAGTCSSGWSTGLWPHASLGGSGTVVDSVNNIRVRDHQMSDLTDAPDIGTFCHENGHMTCDFPDLYSYVNSASIVGYYSLMSSGSHGGGDKHPNSVDPYLKMKAGWADVVDVDAASHAYAVAQVDRNFFYRFKNPAKPQEYFMIENRNNSGYEGPYGGHGSSVAPGRGLAVWHILESGSNPTSSIQQGGTYTLPYEAMIVEATPTTTYTPWYANPSANSSSTDTFRQGQGADPIWDDSSPELKFWAADGRTVSSGLMLHTYGAAGSAVGYFIGAGTPSSPRIGTTAPLISTGCDSGGSPSNYLFNVFNTGTGTLDYTISDDAAWLSCSPTTGSAVLDADPITVTFDTAALAAGVHNATITITASGVANSPLSIPVTVTISNPPILEWDGVDTGMTLFPGESHTGSFGVANSGGGSMAYTVASSAPWLTITSSGGSCQLETDIIYFTASPEGLNEGVYNGTITVTASGASGSPKSFTVQLTVGRGLMLLSPNGGERWHRGYTWPIRWTSNIGTNMRIELLKDGALKEVITAGTADDGVFDWAIPTNYQEGHDYRFRLTSVDEAFSDGSNADFQIVSGLYSDMSNNPGWTFQGLWAYGTPAGLEGDPSSGYTGSNVIGYNLNGGYPANLTSTEWAFSPVLNFQHYANVKLKFQRWLYVSNLADACIEVSNDGGSSWNTVWANPNYIIDDNDEWHLVEYDLSAWADHQDTVQVRWGLGPTNAFPGLAGWNLDDVVVEGDYAPIVIDSPIGGETWYTGSTRQIQWHGGLSSNVRIELLKGGSLERVIIADTANDGAFDWAIPAELAGFDYRIRIASVDNFYTAASPATFTILSALYQADMSSDPGWGLEGQWAYGKPLGVNYDPTAGYTGDNVIGYNLAGNYEPNMPQTLWATTPVFNCSYNRNVKLVFYRWLQMGSSTHKTSVEISNDDGATWHQVWSNGTGLVIDRDWERIEYDISLWADFHSQVKVRWGMGPTDIYGSLYCGWNIDDVLVTGEYVPAAVIAPEGGENWINNSTRQIKWQFVSAGNVKIELLKAGVLDQVIASDTPNDGSFDWAIPSNLFGNDFRVRITTLDEALTAESAANFSIVSTIYSAEMDSNPGWTLQGQWAYGQPTGMGGEHGEADPTSGFTGNNVIGYNLNGDYPMLSETQWATTPSFNCSGQTNITLFFQRWLGVESATYDHACVQVSNDGVNWTDVWANSSTLNGGSWESCQYDISAVANNQPNVRLRWGMGATDSAWHFCGWNIDDVLVTGTGTPTVSFQVTFQTDGTPGASLTGQTSQTVASGQNCSAVTANAPAGWTFVKWVNGASDYSTSNPLTVTNVLTNMTLTAVFANESAADGRWEQYE